METLVCRIELDKEQGVILTVENEDDSIIQTLVMDGASIKTTVAGSKATSEITQTQDRIAIKCTTFIVDAVTINCKSANATLLQSGQDFDLRCGDALTLEARNKATYKAMETDMSSTMQTEIKASSLSLEGTVSAEMKATTIKIESKAMLDLIGNGIANLKAGVVNIASFLKLG